MEKPSIETDAGRMGRTAGAVGASEIEGGAPLGGGPAGCDCTTPPELGASVGVGRFSMIGLRKLFTGATMGAGAITGAAIGAAGVATVPLTGAAIGARIPAARKFDGIKVGRMVSRFAQNHPDHEPAQEQQNQRI